MTASSSPEHPPQAHRLRFELITGSILLALGLFALPGLVYWVGSTMLGPYGKDAGIGTFYGDFFGDLATGGSRAWVLALGPLVIVELLRLLFLRRSGEKSSAVDAASPQSEAHRDTAGRRVEPRVSLD